MFKRLTRLNIAMLLRVIGWLLMIESAFLVVPLLTCLYYGESDWEAFAIALCITATVGVLMTFCIRPGRSDMGKREGFLLTASVWVFFSLCGMIPFMLGVSPIGFTDAFFEAISAFTTTGASTYVSVDNLSHGLKLWRCLMEWLGGMGIILFTLAVIPMLNYSGGMQMFNAEVTGITHEKLRPRVSQTAKGLWFVYFILTGILIVLLYMGPMSLFDSVCYAFSVMSTGGVSTSDAGIGAWDSLYIKIVFIVFMVLGGVNFGLIFKVGTGQFKAVRENQVFRIFMGTIIVLVFMTSIAAYIGNPVHSIETSVVDPLFQVVSMMTSTGFSVPEVNMWGDFVLLLVFLMMFMGGCAGSTSGGAKIDRIIVLLKHSRNEIYRCLHPNSILNVRVNNKVASPDTVSKVIAFLCLYVMIVLVASGLLTILGMPLGHSFFTSLSCISNAGLGINIMGVDATFIGIPDVGKWILSLVMLIGRLELFTVLLLFTTDFWRK